MLLRVHLKPEEIKTPSGRIISLILHGGFAVWLVLWPSEDLKKSPTAYEQLIKGKEAKIVFYQFKDKLPDVKPVKKSDSRPPRAEVKIAKQSIISSPKDAPKEKQMVWMPAPELKTLPEVKSPNILALQISPPAPPQRKKFIPQAAQPKVPNESAKPQVIDAPTVTATKAPADNLAEQLGALPKVSQDNRRKFVLPQAHVSATVAEVQEMSEAAPALPSAAMAASGTSLSQLNIAVVGLNPADKDAPLPQGSHAAQFSAGPKLNPDGGTGEGNPNASLSVPDLMIRGGEQDAKATLMAANRVAPTSAEALRGMSKYGAPSVPEPAPSKPAASAPRVNSVPNPKFEGKEVYSMAIQMPNITSYVGSWLMWYAAHGAGLQGPVAPPVPHRKVDPKYIASAVVERIEGRIQLLCVINSTGHVSQVELVRGLDPRLDRSAMEALAKWEFSPATRSGAPVDVDVMVEIPFRLAPKAPR
jgi:TonB family protein